MRNARWLMKAATFAMTVSLAGCLSLNADAPRRDLPSIPHPNSHAASSLDASASPEVPSDWGEEGDFILLHPTLNSKDVGWFIFDTGATGCTITAAAAEAAGLMPIGRTNLQGDTPTTVFRCSTLRLGPLTLTDLNMSGLNLHQASAAFGRNVVGIIGQNICSSAVIEIDGPSRRLRLYDPSQAPATDAARWHPVEMRNGLPHTRCEYAGAAAGDFLIDTGANAGIHFFHPAVNRSDLLNNPSVQLAGSKSQITFGSLKRVDAGTLADFRIAGRQFATVPATFARSDDPTAHRFPEDDGLIGMALLCRSVFLLDFTHSRLAISASHEH